MAIQLDLNKSAEKIRLDLRKEGVLVIPEADVGIDIDVSGSFKGEHEDGLTNAIITRIVPWAMVFDPDKKLDAWSFSGKVENAFYLGEITLSNYVGYVKKHIVNKVPGWCGSTDYAYVLEKNLKHFGWLEGSAESAPSRTGFWKCIKSVLAFPFRFLFSRRKKSPGKVVGSVRQRRSFIVFITDGANDDQDRTTRLLQEMEDRGDKVYIMFIAVSQNKKILDGEEKDAFAKRAFPYLYETAKRFKNTGLEVISDVSEWVAQDDAALNKAMITKELIDWLNK